jgi:hypothetical protein
MEEIITYETTCKHEGCKNKVHHYEVSFEPAFAETNNDGQSKPVTCTCIAEVEGGEQHENIYKFPDEFSPVTCP